MPGDALRWPDCGLGLRWLGWDFLLGPAPNPEEGTLQRPGPGGCLALSPGLEVLFACLVVFLPSLLLPGPVGLPFGAGVTGPAALPLATSGFRSSGQRVGGCLTSPLQLTWTGQGCSCPWGSSGGVLGEGSVRRGNRLVSGLPGAPWLTAAYTRSLPTCLKSRPNRNTCFSHTGQGAPLAHLLCLATGDQGSWPPLPGGALPLGELQGGTDKPSCLFSSPQTSYRH